MAVLTGKTIRVVVNHWGKYMQMNPYEVLSVRNAPVLYKSAIPPSSLSRSIHSELRTNPKETCHETVSVLAFQTPGDGDMSKCRYISSFSNLTSSQCPFATTMWIRPNISKKDDRAKTLHMVTMTINHGNSIYECHPVIQHGVLENPPLVRWFSHTSSAAAQGGGGSFKNRKPIGEVGCCESQMAEGIHWWTERWFKLCFWSGCNGCSGHLTTIAGCSVV